MRSAKRLRRKKGRAERLGKSNRFGIGCSKGRSSDGQERLRKPNPRTASGGFATGRYGRARVSPPSTHNARRGLAYQGFASDRRLLFTRSLQSDLTLRFGAEQPSE